MTRTAASLGIAAVLACAAAITGAAACGPTGAFLCQDNSECLDGRGLGVCQSTGYCSFPDGVCPSGQRYGEHSDDFSNECVQADDPIMPTGGEDSMTGGGSGGVATGGTMGNTMGNGTSPTLSTTSPTTQTTANTLSTTDTAGEATGDDSAGTDDGGETTGPPTIAADLALWLDFDNGVSVDDSEYAHDLECISSCPTEVSGQFDGGGRFSTSGLSVPGHPALDFSGPFTVSLWARADGSQNLGRGTLLAQPYDKTSSFDLSIQDLDGDTTYDLVSAAEGNGGAVLDAFVVGEWVHVAVVYTPGQQQVFVDGAIRVNSATPMISSQDEPVVVGRFPGALNFGLNGAVDDVRVYRRALTSAELSTVMAGMPLE